MTFGGDLRLTLKAARIMVEAHAGQVRDDGTTPYQWHPFRVSLLVAEDVPRFGRDLLAPYSAAEAVAAALLHDVLEDVAEDQRVVYDGLINVELGERVGRLARLLRNPSKDLPGDTPRSEKKALDRAHYRAPSVPAAVRLVKLCDRADNLTEMRTWRPTRIFQYADESESLLEAVLAGLWESEECLRYGRVATQNAFEGPVARYRRAVADARFRAAWPPQ